MVLDTNLPDEFTLNVEVKWIHIKSGEICDSEGCPITLAVLDELNTSFGEDAYRFVVSDIDTIRIGCKLNGNEWSANTPQKVCQFINVIDEEGTTSAEPFKFSCRFRKM
tara:strand:+ start:12 stop:338 length:327 start_codon:yes stop_codon:yes gene_type:complete